MENIRVGENEKAKASQGCSTKRKKKTTLLFLINYYCATAKLFSNYLLFLFVINTIIIKR